MGDLARLYIEWSKYEKALKYLEKIVNDKKVLPLKRIYSTEMQNLGYTLYYLEKYDEAIEKINISIPILKNMEYKLGVLVAYRNMAEINLALNNQNIALKNFSLSLDYAQQYGFLNHQVILLYKIARIKRKQKDYINAFDILVQAKEIAQKIFRFDLNWKISFEFGLLAMYQKRYKQTINFFEEALNELENYPWLPLIEITEKNIDEKQNSEKKVYSTLIDYYLESGQNEEALLLVQRAKAIQRIKKNQLNYKSEKDELFEKEEKEREKIKGLFNRIVNQSELETELMSDIYSDYVSKIKDYKNLILKIIKKFPGIKTTYNIIYSSIQELKQKLTEKNSILEYYITEKNILIFWLYTSPGGFYSLKIRQLSLSENNIKKNLPEELSQEEFTSLLNSMKTKFSGIENSKEIYYIVGNEFMPA